MTANCTIWRVERRICGWTSCLSTSLSTTATFSSVRKCTTAVGANSEYTYISQGSVATCIKCGGIFNDGSVTNFLEGVSMEEFWESVNIW